MIVSHDVDTGIALKEKTSWDCPQFAKEYMDGQT